LLAGVLLLAFGCWLLLERSGVRVPGIEALWPAFVILPGAFVLLRYPLSGFTNHQAVKAGLCTLLIGWFFLLFSLGVLEYERLAALWPVFPLIVGASAMAGWLASFLRESRYLSTAIACGLVGTIGLAFTLGPAFVLWDVLGWPVMMIVLGALFVTAALIRGALQVVVPGLRRVA
jgi:hypothetical protein